MLPTAHRLLGANASTTPAATHTRRGMTLLEVAVAALIVASIMIVSQAAFVSSFSATQRSRDVRRAALLLDTVMEDVAAQPYQNLLALNGNVVTDGETAASSRFEVEIETFLAEIDMIQVRATVRDIEDDVEIGRVVALRSRP
jgi:prepilin-type N-terminal cleavage/methylation domain-containing protein